MNWTILNFGRHKGKTLPKVLFTDPEWFFWAMDGNVFSQCPTLLREAQLLDTRARNIKIPTTKYPNCEAEYVVDEQVGQFLYFEIVPNSQPHYRGNYLQGFRRHVIDMSIPHRIRDYNKGAYKGFIWQMKECLFGKRATRITDKKANEFFADPTNFS